MKQHTAGGYLRPQAPFDFTLALAFLGSFRPSQHEQTLDDETLTKALAIAGQPIAFQVTSTGTVEEPYLRYTLVGDQPIFAATERAVADRIRFFLSLDDDLRPFYTLAEGDPAFAPVIEQLYGYHQVKFLTPFENAVWAILSQRNAWPVAQAQKQRLAARYGAAVSVADTPYPAFPEPGEIARANPDELLAVVRNERKAPQVGAVAQAFDQVNEAWLRTAPYDEVATWLQRLPGIGAWSADFILLRGLGRMDRIPSGEKRLLAAAEKVYGGPLPPACLEQLGAPYGPYRGYWAHYLRAAT